MESWKDESSMKFIFIFIVAEYTNAGFFPNNVDEHQCY